MRRRRNRGDDTTAPEQTVDGHPWSWETAHHSTVGATHLRHTIECQDHSDSGSFDGGRWAYAIVADGHGSAPHFRSARGAAFAVRALQEVFTTFPTFMRAWGPEATVEAYWNDAARYVVSNWHAQVQTDLINDPPKIPSARGGESGVARFLDHLRAHKGYDYLDTELFPQFRAFAAYVEELRVRPHESLPLPPLWSAPGWDAAQLGKWQAKAYGTTLLGVLVGPEALHWLRIGDGAMVRITGGEADYLVPPPDEAIANETPSLCDENVVHKIQLGTMSRADNFPSALVLTTDGVSNSYENKDGFFKFCRDVVDRAMGPLDVTTNLARWLPDISMQGSGDDMSVALLWATEVAADHQFETETDHAPPRSDNAVETPTDETNSEQESDHHAERERETR